MADESVRRKKERLAAKLMAGLATKIVKKEKFQDEETKMLNKWKTILT